MAGIYGRQAIRQSSVSLRYLIHPTASLYNLELRLNSTKVAVQQELITSQCLKGTCIYQAIYQPRK